MTDINRNLYCRICKSSALTKVFKFGRQPLANAFLKKSQLSQKERFYPLDVYFCKNCHLVQLRDVVSSQILFRDYVYVSSTSSLFVNHFKDFSNRMMERFSLTQADLIIDIGSNDGILLKPYYDKGLRVLGIEPAKNIAKIALKNGIDTIPEFFSSSLAQKIRKKYGLAKLVTATNVFAHINDLDEVIKGVLELLHQDGVFVIEAPYLMDFLDKNLFDTVYHEHLSYFSLYPLIVFFTKWKMRVFDVQKVPTHGGSLRIFVSRESSRNKTSSGVQELIDLERKHKLHKIITYRRFARRINENKRILLRLLTKLRNQGKRIVGYGAPAKGNTLLNYFEIKTQFLDYIVDDSKYKQGLFTPGTHIPVLAPGTLYKDRPDYILLLAWNFAENIIKIHHGLREFGVKFIVPVPKPQII